MALGYVLTYAPTRLGTLTLRVHADNTIHNSRALHIHVAKAT
jgi:hypothetical protein